MMIRFILSLLCGCALATANFAWSPSIDEGQTPSAHPATLVVSCATGTCSDAERAAYQATIDAYAWRGDTLKFTAGHVFPSYNAAAALVVDAPVGGTSGYLTITTTEDAKLPTDGVRITPAYKPLLPAFRMDLNTGSGIYIKGDPTPAEHIRIRGVYVYPKTSATWNTTSYGRAPITIGNTGSDFGYCDATQCASVTATGISSGTGGVVRLTIANHGWSTGDVVAVDAMAGMTGFDARTGWYITVIDANNIDLDDSLFSGTPPASVIVRKQVTFNDIDWQPDDVIVQHVLLLQEDYASVVAHGILMHSRSVVVKDNWNVIAQTNDGEGKGTQSVNGIGPYTIINNRTEAAGENWFFGGGRSTTGTMPGNIVMKYNYWPKEERRWRRQRWSAGLTVFRGMILNGNTNTGGTLNYTYIALNTGVTGPTEPTDAAVGGLTAWPTSGFVVGSDGLATISDCSFTPGSHTCVVDGGVTWALRSTTSGHYWQVKNSGECKTCNGALIEYNVVDKDWNNGQDTAINLKTNIVCIGGGSLSVRRTGTANTSPVGDGRTRVIWVSGQKLPFHVSLDSQDANRFVININGTNYTIDSAADTFPYAGTARGFVSEDELIITEDIGTISGATFTYGVSTDNAPTDMTQRCSDSVTRNVTFRHNIIRNVFKAFVAQIRQQSYAEAMTDLDISNNLMITDNCAWRDKFSIPSTSGCTFPASGSVELGPSDRLKFNHNTIWNIHTDPTRNGSAVGVHLLPSKRRMWGGSMRGNIISYGTTAGVKADGLVKGAASLDAMFCANSTCPAAVFSNNIVLGEASSSYYGATRTSTVCPSTAACGPLYSSFSTPPALIFRGYDSAIPDLRFRLSSPVGRTDGLDGKEAGVDYSRLPQITSLVVTPTDNEVIIAYTLSPAIAHGPCVAEVATSPDFAPGTYAAELSQIGTYYRQDVDTLAAHPRSGLSRYIVFGRSVPLSAGTLHYGRLSCYGDAREFTFTTTAAASGTASLARSTDGCSVSATVARGAPIFYRLRKTLGTLHIDYGTAYDGATITGGGTASAACATVRGGVGPVMLTAQ
jgi:hypothetical protein